MGRFLILFAIVLSSQYTVAQISSNVTLLGTWDDNTLALSSTQYSDIWGYAIDGREFALMGAREKVLFLEVTDPTNITLVAGIGGGSNTTWRDIKTYGTYAYAVSDVSTSEGLLVFDISNITGPDSVMVGDLARVTLVNQLTTPFTKCHNIFIDTEHGFLYAVGYNSGSDILIYDLKITPEAPNLIASLSINGGYLHDIYVKDHIAYGSSGGEGHYIFDVSSVTAPEAGDPVPGIAEELGVLNDDNPNYLHKGYSHSSWGSGDYMVFADETHGSPLGIADISDPTDITVLDRFQSNLLNVATPNNNTAPHGPIPHNPFIVGNLCIVSHYHDGVALFDLSDPTNVTQIGWYDTEPTNTNYSGYKGVWGVYPFLPSGRILASDVLNGLFVLEFTGVLPVEWGKLSATSKTHNIHINWTTLSEEDNAGFIVQRQSTDGTWINIGHVSPSDRQAYHFIDQSPQDGWNTYRIKQLDFDETSSLSSKITALFNMVSSSWQYFPNPVEGGQAITLTNLKGTHTSLRIFNVSGQCLYHAPLAPYAPQNRIRIPDLPLGTYFLSTEDGETHKINIK